MKISARQQKALVVVEYFIPKAIGDKVDMGWFGLSETIESPEGMAPEEAFFLFTDQGKKPQAVTDLKRLYHLLWGQRYMAMHEKMYREDFQKGFLSPFEFDDDPEPVRQFVYRIWKSIEKDWEKSILKKAERWL